MNFLCPIVGEGRARSCRKSLDTALGTSTSSDSRRWNVADALKDNNPLMLEAAIFLAMKSWSYGGKNFHGVKLIFCFSPCKRREDRWKEKV